MSRKKKTIRVLAFLLIPILGLLGYAAYAFSGGIVRPSKQPDIENDLVRISNEVRINVSPDKVWKLVGQDFDNSKIFNVDAKETSLIKGNRAMHGAQRRTVNLEDKFIDVEIIEYDANQRFVKWEIIAMNSAPLKAGYASYQVERTNTGVSILKQNAAFTMKLALLNGMGKKKFGKVLRQELSAIKHYLETGEQASQQNIQNLLDKYGTEVISK